MTRKQAVFNVLKSRRWTPGHELTTSSTGGSEGLRRVRELRADGYDIRTRRVEDSTEFEYRMTSARVIA